VATASEDDPFVLYRLLHKGALCSASLHRQGCRRAPTPERSWTDGKVWKATEIPQAVAAAAAREIEEETGIKVSARCSVCGSLERVGPQVALTPEFRKPKTRTTDRLRSGDVVIYDGLHLLLTGNPEVTTPNPNDRRHVVYHWECQAINLTDVHAEGRRPLYYLDATHYLHSHVFKDGRWGAGPEDEWSMHATPSYRWTVAT
jgi:8-oxo-dGTP pyrophosphatase MutT (NUDIX family)